MTLHDYLTQHSAMTHTYGADGRSRMLFERDVPRESLWDLFHLSDFVVSAAVSGPAYVLYPCARRV
jgi:hypothetical protein